MQRGIRMLSLVVVMLAATACGQGTPSPTTHPGGGTTVDTPTATTASPTAAPSTPLPTPDSSGTYGNLTFALAQQLAPFYIVEPTWVPSSLHDEQISASITNITEVRRGTPAASATPPTGPVLVVSISYWGPYPQPPVVTINELKQGTPLGPAKGPGAGPGITSVTITIAGHTVTRRTWATTAIYPPSGPNSEYVWTDQGTTFQLQAIITESAMQQDVEHMIASMLQ